MKVTIKSWHAVASWTWTTEDDVCGICHMALDGCAPGAVGPGDDSPVVWGRVRARASRDAMAHRHLALTASTFPRILAHAQTRRRVLARTRTCVRMQTRTCILVAMDLEIPARPHRPIYASAHALTTRPPTRTRPHAHICVRAHARRPLPRPLHINYVCKSAQRA